MARWRSGVSNNEDVGGAVAQRPPRFTFECLSTRHGDEEDRVQLPAAPLLFVCHVTESGCDFAARGSGRSHP